MTLCRRRAPEERRAPGVAAAGPEDACGARDVTVLRRILRPIDDAASRAPNGPDAEAVLASSCWKCMREISRREKLGRRSSIRDIRRNANENENDPKHA